MKVIIAGGRKFIDRRAVAQAIDDSGFEITECVCGGAHGADTLGALICHERGIPVRLFPADWEKFGKRAGAIRNKQMATYADAVILMPGHSGTDNMRQHAKLRGLEIFDAT